jgi:lysophospholipase L1-like esterase
MPSPEPRVPAGRPPRRGFALLLVGLALVAALGLAEVLLRVLDLPRTATTFGFLGGVLDADGYVGDRERFWKLRPAPPWVNELGLRGWLPARSRAEDGDLRIVCLGDSCTFGAHVRHEESYPMVLERLLREALPNRRVEAIVGGVPGYTSWQDRVLFERELAGFAPDLTVLYVGGWNDYVPAFGDGDRERASGSRLGRLLRGAVARQPSEAEKDERWAEFRAGIARDGRRVPLADFEENLRAMVEVGRRNGGKVVFVLPPLDEATYAATPIAAEYRAAVREVAAAAGAPVFDAPAAFAARRAAAAVPDGFPSTWPCLYDWVHPSPLGHRLIAEGLFAILRGEGLVVDAAPRAGPRIDAVEQAGNGITVRGEGFVAAGFDRLFAGPFWLADCEVLGDRALRALVPPGLPPGSHPLTMVGRFGVRPLGRELRVAAPALRERVERQADGGLRVTLEVEGPPGWRVQAWLAPGRAAAAVGTQHGVFGLPGAEAGRPAGADEAPFLFERLGLDPIAGAFDADGTWTHRIEVDAETAVGLPERMFVQAIVFEPPATGRAALTEVVELRLRGD